MSTTRVLPSETPRNHACGETVFLVCASEEDAACERTRPSAKRTQASVALEKITHRLCIESASCGECGRGRVSFFVGRMVNTEARPSSAAPTKATGYQGKRRCPPCAEFRST